MAALLAVGLATGGVGLVSIPSPAPPQLPVPTLTLDASVHAGAITLARFSPSGARLLTGDASGTVVVWRVEAGAATPLQSFRRAGGVAEAVFLTPPTAPGAGGEAAPAGAPLATLAALAGGSEAAPPEAGAAAAAAAAPPSASTGFMWATDQGCLAYGDDAGRSSDILQPLNTPIDILEYTPSGGGEGWGLVLLVTRSLLMLQFTLQGSTGRLHAGSRAKLAVKATSVGNAGMRQRAWVGSRVLTTATPEESFVRAWVIGSGGGGGGALTVLDAAAAAAAGVAPAGGEGAAGAGSKRPSDAASAAAPSTSTPTPATATTATTTTTTTTQSYIISSTNTGIPIRRGDRMQALAFSVRTGLLAAGTDSGQVYLWRLAGDPGVSAPHVPWEPMGCVGAGGGICALAWGGSSGGTLSVLTASGGVLAIVPSNPIAKLIPLPAHAHSGASGGEICLALISPTCAVVERRGWEGLGVSGGAAGAAARQTRQLMSASPVGDKARFRGADASTSHCVTWTAGGSVTVWALPSAESYAKAAEASAALGEGEASAAWDANGFRLKPTLTFSPPGGVKDAALVGTLLAVLPREGGGSEGAASVGVFAVDTGAPLARLVLPGDDAQDTPHVCDSRGSVLAVATRAGRVCVWTLGGSSAAQLQLLGSGTFLPPPVLQAAAALQSLQPARSAP